MQFEKILKIIETHTAGSPTRHIVGGAPQIKGTTMAEKMQYLHDHHDWIRKVVMQEPRGHASMSGALYVPPCNPEADMGILYFDACDYMTMCGHSTIAVSTVLVEAGMVEKKEPVTTVKLDTPAGLVTAEVRVENGNVKEVTFANVPSFLYASQETMEFPGNLTEIGDELGDSFFRSHRAYLINLKQVKELLLKENNR